MKGAADALKKTHKDMNIDNVHEMMDDIAEQNDVANEISNAISSGIISSGVDEDELAKELEELEQENLDKELLDVGPAPPSKLPDVPSTDLPSASKEKKKGMWITLYVLLNESLNFIYFICSKTSCRRRRGRSGYERAYAMGKLSSTGILVGSKKILNKLYIDNDGWKQMNNNII